MSEKTDNINKNGHVDSVVAPLSGEIRHLVEVPDLVFSRKLTGEGIAIQPTNNTLIAPFDGEVIQLFPTLHAIGIRSNSGLELLIHIGLGTVALKGEGFEAFVKEGDKIVKGDALIEFDLAFIEANASSTVTPIIITNGNDIEDLDLTKELHVELGTSVLFTAKVK